MSFCGTCDGTVGMINLNDDGTTYTIHLEDIKGEHHPIQVNVTTLEKLRSAINIQMFMSRELKYVSVEDDEDEF